MRQQTMLEGLQRTIQEAGVFGWLAILCGLCVLATGGVLLAQGKHGRGLYAVLLLAGLLPLCLGLVGTQLGHMLVDRALGTQETNPYYAVAEGEAGRRQAWTSTWVGLVASLPSVLLGLVGVLFAGGPRRPSSGARSAG